MSASRGANLAWAPATGPALPLHRIEPEQGVVDSLPVYLAVDHCLPVAPGFTLLQGWMLDPSKRLARLEAGSDDAFTRVTIAPSAMLHGRGDVDQGLREHYVPYGYQVPVGTAQGFYALVPLADNAAHVPLIAHLANGNRQTWHLPVHSNEAASQKLLAESAPWFGAVLAPLCRDLHRIPVDLLRLLDPANAGGNPEARLEFDAALRIESGVFVSGWGVGADDAPLSSMFVLTGDAQVPVLRPEMGRIARPDVIQHLRAHRNVRDPDLGFLAWLPDLEDVDRSRPWTFVVPDGKGGLFTRQIPLRDGSEQEATATTLLHSVPLHNPAFRAIYDQHTGPALEAYYAPRRARARPPVRTLQFGTPVESPEVSILVPLYGRWDFMEYQIAQFRHDPTLANHELIYYVDDPSIYDGIVQYWRSTYPLYEFPFTLAFTGENLGFAGANNAAASCARGRQLLLLNSDRHSHRSGLAGAAGGCAESTAPGGRGGPNACLWRWRRPACRHDLRALPPLGQPLDQPASGQGLAFELGGGRSAA